MKISFIIASLDENDNLQKCISSIETSYEKTRNTKIEIVVVFNGNIKNKNHIMPKHSDLISVYSINKYGLSNARNYGIKKCSGEYIVFIDDDALIKSDFLNVLIKNISEYPIPAFCGRILDPQYNIPFARIFNNTQKKNLRHLDFRYFMGSSHVLSKKIIDKIGSYDERFGAGAKYYGAEESDMFFKLLYNNEKVLYLPDLVIFHPINTETSPEKVFNYSYAIGAMLTKQMFSDNKHVFIYLRLLSDLIFKTAFRSLQNIIFPKSLEIQNKRYRYNYAMRGTIFGLMDFIKNESKQYI